MILVAGEILFDIFEDRAHIGGAPFNFAFHLKQLGLPVRFVTRVGDDDPGRQILQILENHGFGLEDVQVDNRHATGQVNVTVDADGVPKFDIIADAAYDHIDFESVSTADKGLVKMIYFGTLAQRTSAAFKRWRSYLRQYEKPVQFFCDLNLRPPQIAPEVISTAMGRANILKLNSDELGYLQKEFKGPAGFDETIDWLMTSYDISTIAVTRGDKGSTLVSQDQRVDMSIPRGGPVVDTVGAGDAFAAILALGLLKQWPLAETAELASIFSAEICTYAGALPDDRNVYRPLIKRIQG